MVNECFFNIDDDAIKNMIKVADIEGDGKINKYEFLRIMKKIKLL
jgi:Ca2+-binding EF-hand superfamily protein